MTSRYRDQAPRNDSPAQRLATLLLGEDVREFIDHRRQQGRAWRFIARDLYERTNGQVDVTYETLRQWHTENAESVKTATH